MAEYATLRDANIARQADWGIASPSLSFRGNELAGEAGEAAEVVLSEWVKARSSRDRLAFYDALADELSDIVICCDLIGMDLGLEPLLHHFNAQAHPNWGTWLLRYVGLVCNQLKKLERTSIGLKGGIDATDLNPLRNALGKVVDEAYSMASTHRILMDIAVPRKFNKTSAKLGLATLYVPPGVDRALIIQPGA